MAAPYSALGSRIRNFRRKVVRASWRFTPFKHFLRPVIRKTLSSRLMPRCWLRSFRLYRILSFDYGYLRSAATMRSVDAAGEPVPWITYPAIEFLKQLDLGDKTVFEYGCGGSTMFWSRAAKHVDSVEHDDQFYREVGPVLRPNCTLYLENVRER
jgi:hypothetical protein